MDTSVIPTGLSVESQQVWRDLMAQHRFETHERSALENALRWHDQSTALLADAAAAAEPDRSRLRKLAMDAATCSLRYWRYLKFTDGAVRRPGRPSDDNWSPQRRLQKLR